MSLSRHNSNKHGKPILTPPQVECVFRQGAKIAATHGDLALAHDLFKSAVQLEPSNVVYLDAFLDNLHVIRGRHQPRMTSLLVGLSLKLYQAWYSRDWNSVLRIGANRLCANPTHVPTLLKLATASEQLHFPEVELRYLKQALDASGHSARVEERCALALARAGQFDQAIACWRRLERDSRHQVRARTMVSQLLAAKASVTLVSHDERSTVHNTSESPMAELKQQEPVQDVDMSGIEVEFNEREHAISQLSGDAIHAVTGYSDPEGRRKFGGLELVVLALTVCLVLQLVPSIPRFLWEHVRATALVGNLIFVFALLIIRRSRVR